MYFKVCTLTAQNAKALVRLIALLQPCCFLYYALGGTCKVYEQSIYREEEMSKHEQCSGQERIVISSVFLDGFERHLGLELGAVPLSLHRNDSLFLRRFLQ